MRCLLVSSLVISAGLAWEHLIPEPKSKEYEAGDRIPVLVEKLTSRDLFEPYGFYDLSYCRPPHIESQRENLGEKLLGYKLQNSAIEFAMLKDESCRIVCTQNLTQTDVLKFVNAIDDNFIVNMVADELPVGVPFSTFDVSDPEADLGLENTAIQAGVPVGFIFKGQHILINHWDFTIEYRKIKDTDKATITKFLVKAGSLSFEEPTVDSEPNSSCKARDLMVLNASPTKVMFTYAVTFRENFNTGSSRWESYLAYNGDSSEVHWFSVINAIMIVLLLSGIIAVILFRTLLRDIARYNQLEDIEDLNEESGWKLVHGDVFRRPNHSRLLAVSAGSGVQLLAMLFLTLLIALFGLLSPAHRGAFMQSALLLFTFMGLPAGYTAARFNKLFDGGDIQRNLTVTSLTATLFPGACFAVFFCLNIILSHKGSSSAVSLGTVFLLLLLWFGISLPLVFIGSKIGYNKGAISLPVRTNQIPRQIPPSRWLIHPLVTDAISGILPFCAVFTELLFILRSFWLHRFYYLFGFLFVVVLILIVVCAEISIASTYFQLCSENYQWWWRSFWASGSSAIYVFLYSLFFFHTRLSKNHMSSVVLYFGYTALMSYAFLLLTGAVGFISTFFFVRAIYGAIKVD